MFDIISVAADKFQKVLQQAEGMGMIERTILLLNNLKMGNDQWKRTFVVTLAFFTFLFALR